MKLLIIAFLCFFIILCTRADTNLQRWVRQKLEDHHQGSELNEIIQMTTSPAFEKGQAFEWNLTRIQLNLKLKNGQIINNSALLIDLPKTEYHKKQISEANLFNNDINVYKYVLPIMDNLMNKMGDNSERPWVEAYGYEEFTSLLLKDIEKQQFYEVKDRIRGLDMVHSRAALKNLAKFHALSAVLVENSLIKLGHFNMTLLQKNKDKIKNFWNLVFQNFAISIENNWGPEWQEIASKVKEKSKTITDDILKLQSRNEDAFNVLNIGAYDIRKIFFKYKVSDLFTSEHPIAVKSMGYQLASYGSPAMDLQFFFATSLNNKTRKHREELIETYFQALDVYLTKYGYGGKIKLKDLKCEMKRTELIGLATAVNQLSYMYLKSEDLPDLEKIAKEVSDTKKVIVDSVGMYNPLFIETMKGIIKNAVDEKVI